MNLPTKMLAKQITHSKHARWFGWSWAVFAPLAAVALFAAFNPEVAAQEPRSAIFTGNTPIGVTSADADIDDEARISELEARLAELLREQESMTAELGRWAANEIATVTDMWEEAIAQLRAEVMRGIRQLTSDFEFERRQVLRGFGGDTSLRSLKAELDAAIKEKWAWFEFESGRKQRYLHDDIAEIEQSKAFELEYISSLIHEVEFELQGLIDDTRPSADQTVDAAHSEETERDELPEPAALLIEETTDQSPETSVPEDSGPRRGFFFNSISADTNSLNRTLDPTTLAVIGILFTLAATVVQLVKGN